MAYQFKLLSSAILLCTSKRLICNGTTRILLSLLKRYEVSNTKKRWQNGLLFLTHNLPEQVAKYSCKKKEEPAYQIKKISSKDKEPTLKFLIKYFFRDEPVAVAAKLLDSPDGRCIELEEYAASTLDEGVSLAAVDDNGEYVGVVVNGLIHRNDVEDCDKVEKCPNPRFKRVLLLLTHLFKECKLWEKVPASCDTVMELRMASTHPEWRGRRIMKVLAAESERIAKENCACAIRMDATSIFSGRAAERLGYKNIYTIAYADFPEGPQPAKPHVQASVYLKILT